MANSLVKGGKKQSFSVFLTQDAIKKKINEVIGGKGGQRFMTAILSAVTNSPALQECDSMSILNWCVSGGILKPFPLAAAGAVLHGSLQKEGSAGQRHFGHGASFNWGTRGTSSWRSARAITKKSTSWQSRKGSSNTSTRLMRKLRWS